MNRSRRMRKRMNQLQYTGKHTHEPGVVPDGKRTPGPVNCERCRPRPKRPMVHGDGEKWRPAA